MTPSDDELAAQADPALGQHFLVSAEKLSKLVAAAGIRPEDDVVDPERALGPSRENSREQEASPWWSSTAGSCHFSGGMRLTPVWSTATHSR
jgi:hypothetical protein